MRFQSRAFIICFVPFALLLGASFWMVQRLVQRTVRTSLRQSLRENQLATDRLQSRNDLQNDRFLQVAGENAALKAGIQLLLTEPANPTARLTVEDQLTELGEHMGFDMMLVSSPSGGPLAGVSRVAGGSGAHLAPIETARLPATNKGLFVFQSTPFQLGSAPIDANSENIATLWVGRTLDLTEFATPVALLHNGSVVSSTVSAAPPAGLEAALHHCKAAADCDLRIRGQDWISLPLPEFVSPDGYSLRSFQNIDAAIGPVQSTIDRLFLTVVFGSVFIVCLCSVFSSRSMIRPLGALIAHLRQAARTGDLTEFEAPQSPILEVRQLTDSYNRAAVSARLARENLQGAYVEFVGSLANALDARDEYTAGHSWRVSQLACAIGAQLQVPPGVMDRIRIGALLHDIGKIGLSDKLLQKPDSLTDREFAIIREHPLIGRRILEGVQGFTPYLPAVELHHENWDGSGYPHQQTGTETPIEARIIHVADAYDAMTTDRPYRAGMPHHEALRIIVDRAGRQFDPRIADVLNRMPHAVITAKQPDLSDLLDIEALDVELATIV